MEDVWPVAEAWPELAIGTALIVIKQNLAGQETARYPGTIIASAEEPPWVTVRTTWARDRLNLDGLEFVPGDTFHEYFSPADPFNVIALFAPDGQLRGWYANVAYPSRLRADSIPPVLIWRDLYLDVVALPDGAASVLDEDELAASGLTERDPALYAAILRTRDDLLGRIASRAFPFHEDGK